MTSAATKSAAARLAEATEAVRAAETVLARTLEAITTHERADKQMIGAALRDALDALSAARSNLDAIQTGDAARLKG